MLNNAVDYINNERAIPYIPYGIECDMNIFSDYETWINVPISQEHRAMLIDTGIEYAKSDYEKWIQQQQQQEQKMDDCVEDGDNTTTLTSEPNHDCETIRDNNEEL